MTTAAPATSQPQAGESAGSYTYRWVLAWALVLILAGALNRTRAGHAALYYALSLALVFLLVTQYKWFARALSPITGARAA